MDEYRMRTKRRKTMAKIMYTCKECGGRYELKRNMELCPHCQKPIRKENDASGELGAAQNLKIEKAEDLNALVKAYKESAKSADIRSAVQSYDEYMHLMDFDRMWRKFILDATAVACELRDKELQIFLKNHAKQFDITMKGTSLLLSLLQAYPKVGNNNDWDELIRKACEEKDEFGVLCDWIIAYIVKNNDRVFAFDIFKIISAKGAAWVGPGRTYVRALLDSEDVATAVFPVSAFNRPSTRKHINEIRAYCKRFLVGENSVAFDESKVWENYIESCRVRKKRTLIAVIASAAAVAVIGLVTFLILNATNKKTIAFQVEKIIEVTYGDDLDLDGFTVYYKKNSGKEITLPLTVKMLNGYDPESVGTQQSAYFEFAGIEAPVTIIVKRAQLSAPKLTQSGNYVTWETVPNAQSYAIYVNAVAAETEKTTSLSYDLSQNPNHGQLTVTVRALTDSNKYESSPASEPLVVTKLASPTDFVYEEGVLTWGKVDGAQSYELMVNGTPFVTSTNSCNLTLIMGNNEISINAKGADSSVVHGITKTTLYYNRLDPITAMSYGDDKVSWEASSDAKSFDVYVNGSFWKNFNGRNYFDITKDGFKDAFGDGNHDIGIVCKTSVVGIEASKLKGFKVAVGNTVSLADGTITWTNIGTGATYNVYVNGTLHVYGDSYFSITDATWSVGENTVSISAKYSNEDYILETFKIVKHAKPTVSASDTGWVTETAPGVLYSVNGGEWTAELPDISTVTTTAMTIRAKRGISATGALELESDVATVTVARIERPTIRVEYGELECQYDGSKYNLNLYIHNSTLGEWVSITSLDAIAEPGEQYIQATLSAKSNGAEIFLTSLPSDTLTVTKPETPTVTYNKETGIISSNIPSAKFYYEDENGEEHEIVGGKVSNLPGGVFTVYARVNASLPNELHSENTPLAARVSVFNLDIVFRVTIPATGNQCYFVFDGCADIESLVFTYDIQYLDADGNVIGGIDKSDTPKEATKADSTSDMARCQINYRVGATYESGYDWKSVKKVVFTIYVTSGTDSIQKSYTVTV